MKHWEQRLAVRCSAQTLESPPARSAFDLRAPERTDVAFGSRQRAGAEKLRSGGCEALACWLLAVLALACRLFAVLALARVARAAQAPALQGEPVVATALMLVPELPRLERAPDW